MDNDVSGLITSLRVFSEKGVLSIMSTASPSTNKTKSCVKQN